MIIWIKDQKNIDRARGLSSFSSGEIEKIPERRGEYQRWTVQTTHHPMSGCHWTAAGLSKTVWRPAAANCLRD